MTDKTADIKGEKLLQFNFARNFSMAKFCPSQCQDGVKVLVGDLKDALDN